MPPADGRTMDQPRLLGAFELTHVQIGEVRPAVRLAHLRGALRVRRAGVARVARVRPAGGLADRCGSEARRTGARRERERQQGHHGRGHEHFSGTHHYCLLWLMNVPLPWSETPMAPPRPAPRRPVPPPVVIPAAYLSPSGRDTVVVWPPPGPPANPPARKLGPALAQDEAGSPDPCRASFPSSLYSPLSAWAFAL